MTELEISYDKLIEEMVVKKIKKIIKFIRVVDFDTFEPKLIITRYDFDVLSNTVKGSVLNPPYERIEISSIKALRIFKHFFKMDLNGN